MTPYVQIDDETNNLHSATPVQTATIITYFHASSDILHKHGLTVHALLHNLIKAAVVDGETNGEIYLNGATFKWRFHQ